MILCQGFAIRRSLNCHLELFPCNFRCVNISETLQLTHIPQMLAVYIRYKYTHDKMFTIIFGSITFGSIIFGSITFRSVFYDFWYVAYLSIFRHNVGGSGEADKLPTSKYIGSRCPGSILADFRPPGAEKSIFWDKTLACSIDLTPKHM